MIQLIFHFDNDIGTEELAHLEIVGTIVHQLTKGVPAKIMEA
ncbi:manganese catalase family protein, partial [Pseudobacteroides cellulosolvens]